MERNVNFFLWVGGGDILINWNYKEKVDGRCLLNPTGIPSALRQMTIVSAS